MKKKETEIIIWEVIWKSPEWSKPQNNIYKYFQTKEEAQTFCDMNKLPVGSITQVTLHEEKKFARDVIERHTDYGEKGYEVSYMKILPNGEAIYDPKTGWQQTSNQYSTLGENYFKIFGERAISPLPPKHTLLFCYLGAGYENEYQAYFPTNDTIKFLNSYAINRLVYRAEYYPDYYGHKDVFVLSTLDNHEHGQIYKRLNKSNWIDLYGEFRLKRQYGYVSGWITNEYLEEMWDNFIGNRSCIYMLNNNLVSCLFPYLIKKGQPKRKRLIPKI